MDRKIRVMIAEDFEIIREDFIEKINDESDMIVVGSAGSGKEIMELAETTKCDIILMDMEMEKINSGLEAAEIIFGKFPDINIIFLTIHEADDLVFSALSVGAVDYVIKTTPFETIAEHIRNMYHGTITLLPEIQERLRYEFSRLKRSEQSLFYFITKVTALTPAEKMLIRLLMEGKKVVEIAKIRSVEVVTVKTQIQGLLRKFECRRTKDIVKMIYELELERLFL